MDEYKSNLLVFKNDPDDDIKFNKNKKDIIYLFINKGRKSKPETIKKYNIEYNSELGKYY